MSAQRGYFGSVPIDSAKLAELAQTLIERARTRRGGYVCVANVHMATLARRDPAFCDILRGAWRVVSDGMPLVWLLRRQGMRSAERIAGPDLLPHLCMLSAAQEIPVFFYGGSEADKDRLETVLKSRFPGLRIAGIEAPPQLPTMPALDMAIIDRIDRSQAMLLFVGLGCPKQEYWMAQHAPRLDCLAIGFGAAFDYLAANKARAPRWMQRTGMEWLFRLWCEPKRLWKRYLITNSVFIAYVVRDMLLPASARRRA
jgi:N-acetylglucosaminyldiphosphoundecaprenol N-acetyl-beta-D-mannosaminyltransferase